MSNQNKSVSLLFNPSVYIAGGPALGLGVLAILLAGFIGSLGNAHFDGVLDTHVGAHVPLWVFLIEGILDWLCMGLVLWILGRIISRTDFRTLDVFGTQALARWPTIFISLVLLPRTFQQFVNDLVAQLRSGGVPKTDPTQALVFAVIVLAVIIFVCWMVALMYKAFSVSCNVSGGKAIGTFVGGILLAEILSKICMILLLHYAVTSHPAAVSANPPVSTSATAPLVEDPVNLSATGAAFVDLLARKDFAGAESHFDSTMKSVMPESRLRAVWEELLGQAGPFQKQLRTREEKQAGYDVVFVTCQFANKVLDMKVVYDSQQRVAGLFYLPASAQ